MTTTITPLDNPFATTFNNVALGDDDALAQRFDSALRTLITATDGRKIQAIKILRDFTIIFGGEMGMLEAKSTIDAMIQRMVVETLRSLLASPVGSENYDRLLRKLDTLDPHVRAVLKI